MMIKIVDFIGLINDRCTISHYKLLTVLEEFTIFWDFK